MANGKPKPAFYIVLGVVVLGLLAVGLWRMDLFAPKAPKDTGGGQIDPGKLGGGTAEAASNTSPTTTDKYVFVPGDRLPAVKGVSAYKPLQDKTVRFAINVWAGWGPIIYANNGMKAGKAWKTPQGEDFKVDLVLIDDPVQMLNTYAGGDVHIGWATLDMVPLFMERYSTTASERGTERDSDSIVKVAYGHFIREPLRTFARDEVQRRNGLEVKDALIPIGDAVLGRIQAYAADSPFVISSVVVGNVQYPAEVADAVSRKLAATQELQRKDTEIEIERKERTKREVQAQGIANAMQIIRGQLSAMYIQHEAIEAQKLMVNSPNHTVVYIPSGAMGVPLTGTMTADAPATRIPK